MMAISSSASGFRSGVCTSTTRPSSPYTGQLIYETDSGYMLVWDGSAWDYLAQAQATAESLPIGTYGGLTKIVPTSVTNGTIGTTGNVTVNNAVSSVTIRCFSSLYDFYKISITGVSGASGANLGARMSNNGTAATTGYYGGLPYMSAASSSAYVGANDNNASSFSFLTGVGHGTKYSAMIEIFNPFATEETRISSSFVKTVGATDVGTYTGALYNSTSYNEIVFIPNTGTLSGGTIRIYGYRN